MSLPLLSGRFITSGIVAQRNNFDTNVVWVLTVCDKYGKKLRLWELCNSKNMIGIGSWFSAFWPMTHIDLCSPLQLFGDWVSNQFLLSITEFFYQETLYYFFPVPQTCLWWQPQSIGKSENSSQIVAASGKCVCFLRTTAFTCPVEYCNHWIAKWSCI